MSGELVEKHAVVTGGGKGIGLAIARVLARAGANVSIFSRSAADTGDGFVCFRADILDEEQIQAAFDAARAKYGPVAILINNSGIAESAPLKRTERALWDRTIGTNLTGTYLCSRQVIEDMIAANWGRIVNIASIAGLYGAPYISAYSASKHGVVGLTRSLAAELAGTGVTVNAVCPGYTETDMIAGAIANIVKRTGLSAEQARAELAKANPGGRIVTPEEVANAVLDLCSGDETGREVVLA